LIMSTVRRMRVPKSFSPGRSRQKFEDRPSHLAAPASSKMPARCGSHRHESSNQQTILHRDMTKKSSFATKYEFERALYCGVCNARHPHLAEKPGKDRGRPAARSRMRRQQRTRESLRESRFDRVPVVQFLKQTNERNEKATEGSSIERIGNIARGRGRGTACCTGW
jgi:hypothetical protein